MLAVATFLSCLAVPVPTSLMMLAAGAFAASGDLALAAVLATAFGGAALGDQAGFWLGRKSRVLLTVRFFRRPGPSRLLQQARTAIAGYGASSVFLSRWLFSPLGPHVNLLAGGVGMDWARFTAMSLAGEAVWVAVYVGMGFAFASQIVDIARILSDSIGLLTSALISVLAGFALFRRRHRP